MKDGFITVATATPQVAVADCEANTQAILACINEMAAAHAKVMVLPELCITGYTCSDLFWQTKLLDEAEAALSVIAEGSRQVDALIAVGMPLRVAGKLLNVAAILCRGKVLGFVPKVNLPAYNEFYETRHFPARLCAVSAGNFFNAAYSLENAFSVKGLHIVSATESRERKVSAS